MSEHLTESEQKLESAIQGIFQIGTGALALSITFRGEIAPEAASAKWLLSLSWIFLALVPISYVFLRLMEAAKSMFWHNLNQKMQDDIQKGLPASPIVDLPPKLKILMAQAELCWKSLIYSFLLGIVFLLLFGLINNGF